MSAALAMLVVAAAVLGLFFLCRVLLLVAALAQDARRLRRLTERRCMECAQRPRCAGLLAARDWKALRAACPDPAFVDSLRAA